METNLLKKVQLEWLLDLKIDYAFKQLFGNEKNKELTIEFINAILEPSGWDPIVDVLFDNECVDGKHSSIDLLATTTFRDKINVEILFSNKDGMIERSKYDWSSIYQKSLGERRCFDEINPAVSINIVDINSFVLSNRYHTVFHLYEHEHFLKLTDMMEFHFIRVGKLIRAWEEGELDPRNDVLAKWSLMLGMVDRKNERVHTGIYKELEEIAKEDKNLRKAFEYWAEISSTEQLVLEYESRLKNVLNEK